MDVSEFHPSLKDLIDCFNAVEVKLGAESVTRSVDQ